LELNSIADGQDVSFNGAGAELIIDTAASLTGHIHGLATTDEIDLQAILYGNGSATASYDGATGIPTVTGSNGAHTDLNIGTRYSGANFKGSDDGSGCTLITLTAAADPPTITSATSDQFVKTSGGATDHAGGTISFTDVDLTDRPVVTAPFQGYVYKAADGVTNRTLTAQQQADVGAALTFTPAPGNTNNGSTTWSYDVVDTKFGFLSAGETLTLTYTATVTDVHGLQATQAITVTVHGSGDHAPVVAAADK